MKNTFLAFTLLVSFNAFAHQDSKVNVSGQVGNLVLEAMKSAGIKPVCGKDSCRYSVKNFYSAIETDGCGGATTSFETSFTYADATEYSFRYCEGDARDGGENPNKAKTNKAAALGNILNDLGLWGGRGWISSVNLEKIECLIWPENKKSSADCELTLRIQEK